MKIKNIEAFQVFDSRGHPTLEVEVVLENGVTGSAMVPSGASTGQYEALELRDGDPHQFQGRSVYKAIGHVNGVMREELAGRIVHDQARLDHLLIELDGTPDKSRLGANAIVGVSMALARTSSLARELPLFQSLTKDGGNLLPLPQIQIIGGGAHANGRIDIQDFMIICPGARDYSQCLEMAYKVYHHCGRLLKEEGKLCGVADEGGYWPVFDSNKEVLEFMVRSIKAAGYQPGRDIGLALDIAATEFYHNGRYHLQLEDQEMAPSEFYEMIADWCRRYPILSIEDPFADTDEDNWKRFTAAFGDRIQIVGDDLFTTDTERVRSGHKKGLANSVLIKLNQIGTVTETIDCIRETQSMGWTPIVSARSGETEDPFIAHLAMGTNAGQLKVGSFARSERMVKWNEVIRISRQLEDKARYVGAGVFPGWKV